MKKYVLIAIICLLPLLQGFTYIDNEPQYYEREVLLLESNTSYIQKYSSFYRNLETVTIEFEGSCEDLIFLVEDHKSGKIYYQEQFDAREGRKTFDVDFAGSKGKELRITVVNTQPDTLSWIETPEQILNITKTKAACGIVLGGHEALLEGPIKRSVDIPLFIKSIVNNEEEIPAKPVYLTITYTVEGIDKLRDDITYLRWANHKYKDMFNQGKEFVSNTLSIYIFIMLLIIILSLLLSYSKAIELACIVIIPAYLIIEIIDFLFEGEGILLVPLVIIITALYIIQHFGKITNMIKTVDATQKKTKRRKNRK